jgi:hypothetical protein
MRTAALVGFILASAAPAAPPPALDMTAFFTGRSHADNGLKVAFKRSVRLVVDSIGGKGDRGDFVLIDKVQEGDKPTRERKWIMRPTGPNRYTGTLSDAVGPVEISVTGDRAAIRYEMKGGLKVDQQLQLRADGTLTNHVVVRKFGLTFATVDGTIRKLD